MSSPSSATSLVHASEPANALDDEGNQDRHQYLTFLVGKESYAIGILRIKEIIEYAELTAVPMMPRCVRGVINLRGAVVPVLDLASRFGGAQAVPTRRTCIVIVEIQVQAGGESTQDLGVIVDAVNEVVEIPAGEIAPAPSFGTRIPETFIEGMGKVAGKFVIVLNVDRVLSADDIVGLAGAPSPELAA
jgi:purine-binding chemotaxis protein CheW